jgi:hypothetical protein
VIVLFAKLPTADAEIVFPDTPTDAVSKPPVPKVPIVAPTTEDDTLPELSCPLNTAALASLPTPLREASVTRFVAILPKAVALTEFPATTADPEFRASPDPEVALIA